MDTRALRVAIPIAIVAAALLFGVAAISAVMADVNVTDESFDREVGARVLRDYPMPGDPHDAVASFGELYEKAVAGTLP